MNFLTSYSEAQGSEWTEPEPQIRNVSDVLNQIINSDQWKRIDTPSLNKPYSVWYRTPYSTEYQEVPAAKIRIYRVIE